MSALLRRVRGDRRHRRPHFVISRFGGAWLVTIRRRRGPQEVIELSTLGEVNQLRLALSSESLRGVVLMAQP